MEMEESLEDQRIKISEIGGPVEPLTRLNAVAPVAKVGEPTVQKKTIDKGASPIQPLLPTPPPLAPVVVAPPAPSAKKKCVPKQQAPVPQAKPKPKPLSAPKVN